MGAAEARHPPAPTLCLQLRPRRTASLTRVTWEPPGVQRHAELSVDAECALQDEKLIPLGEKTLIWGELEAVCIPSTTRGPSRSLSPPPAQVEPYQGQAKDDTALNGLRLHCTRGSHGGKSEAKTAESQSNVWGHWTNPLWCPPGGYLTGFSLRVERIRRGLSDYMGATNIRFACSDGKVLEGPGLPWGEYGAWSPSCLKGLCGIQTKQEAIRGVLVDDSALNDIRFLCCTQ